MRKASGDVLAAAQSLRHWAKVHRDLNTPSGETLVMFWYQATPNAVGFWEGVSAGELYRLEKALGALEEAIS